MASINDLPPEVLEVILQMTLASCPNNATIDIAMAPRGVCRRWRDIFDTLSDTCSMYITWYDTIVSKPPGKFSVTLINPRPSQVQTVTPARSVVVINVWMLESMLVEMIELNPKSIYVNGKKLQIGKI